MSSKSTSLKADIQVPWRGFLFSMGLLRGACISLVYIKMIIANIFFLIKRSDGGPAVRMKHEGMRE
jgi:hypothetical protein